MKKLAWKGMKKFHNAARQPLYPSASSKATGAFFKQYKNLAMYTIMQAGHMVRCLPLLPPPPPPPGNLSANLPVFGALTHSCGVSATRHQHLRPGLPSHSAGRCRRTRPRWPYSC